MKRFTPRLFVAALAAAMIPASLTQAAVTPLGFTDGTGTSLVDQFTGAIGGGWTTGWSALSTAGTIGYASTVTNTTPLSTGGGNYLAVNFTTDGSNNFRTSAIGRQWDTSGASISLNSPITISFDFRSNTPISSGNQVFTMYGSTTVNLGGTTANDSWRLSMDGAGVYVVIDQSQPFTTSPPSNIVLLATRAQMGTDVAGTPLRFSFTIDPVADTYTASVTRLDTNATFTSGATTLLLRNGANSSLSYINILAGAGQNLPVAGYSVDNYSVVAVPEPGSVALIVVAGVFCLLVVRRRHRRA